MLKLALRTLPLFAVIVGFAMALGAYMNYSGVRGAYLDLIDSRMEMVLDDLETNVQSAVSLGIPPAEQVTLPPFLRRLAEADPLIEAIDVAATDGTVLFSSDPARRGEREPEESGFAISRTVTNDFGAPVVALHVHYDARQPTQSIDRFGRAVLADALPAGLFAVLAGCLAAFLVLRRLHRRALQAVEHSQSDVIDAADRAIDELGDDLDGAAPPSRAT